MKYLSYFIGCSFIVSFSLFGCMGATPPDSAAVPIPMQDNSPTSPVLVGEAIVSPLAPPDETAKETAPVKPTLPFELDENCKSWTMDGMHTIGLTETLEVILSEPKCDDKPVPPKTRTPEEQAVIATALAFMGNDKAPNLKIARINRLTKNGKYIIHFRQRYHGILVDDAEPSVIIDPNQPPKLIGHYYSEIDIPSITPTITRDEVVAIAVKRIGIEGEYSIFSQPWLVIDDVLSFDIKGTYILKWRVALKTNCPLDEWFVEINAYTGDVLRLQDITRWGLLPPPDDRNCPTPQPVPRPTRIPAP